MKRIALIAIILIALVGACFIAIQNLVPSPNKTPTETIGLKTINEIAVTHTGSFTISSYTSRDGPKLVLVPSLGRDAIDFNELVIDLNIAGFQTQSVDAPVIKKITDNVNLNSFSRVTLTTVDLETPTVLIGHAFGNRVARMAAYQNPENVKAVILLAAGGQVPMEPKVEQSLRDIFNPMKSHKARMKDVEYAFFAEGNEIPDHWTRGWHTQTAVAQGKAVAASADDDSWHCAGGVPMLIVQPMQDRIAPIENAYALQDKCPQEVEIVEVQNAGHALLPEQPEAVANAVLAFLAKHHPVN